MSKSVYSIIMLFLMGIGLSGVAVFQILKGTDSDHVFLGLFYLAAGVVAFVSLLRLRTKPVE